MVHVGPIMDWLNTCCKDENITTLLFFFPNVIIFIPSNILNKIQRSINSFRWKQKKPHRKMVVLTKQSRYGGLAIPNINLYYHTAILVSIMQWWKGGNRISWHMEQMGMGIPLSETALLVDCRWKARSVNETFKFTWKKI